MKIALKKFRINRQSTQLVLVLFFLVSVVFPLLKMFFTINPKSIKNILQSHQFLTGLLNSLTVTITAAFFSVALAYLLAWAVSRSQIKYKSIFSILLTIPMLIPSISHSIGLIMLFGKNGIITKFFHLSGSIYGFSGIVLGSMLYSFPFAFLMLLDVLQYEDYTAYEAASVLGIPRWKQTKDITLSYLKKPLLSVMFATFTIIFTDYGVPITIGGKFITLPVIMYQEVIGQLNFGKGSVIGMILLIPALLSFTLDTLTKEKGNTSFITTQYVIKKNKLRDIASYIIIIAVCLFILMLNLSFVLLSITKQYPIDLSLTLTNIAKTFHMNGFTYLLNSFIISIFVALIGTFIGFTTSYFTARIPSKTSRFLHLISITSLAIPGIVLGLSYVLLFKSTFLYGSIIILVMVNIAHFSASPYLMMYNTFGKLNSNLESVSDTLGIKRVRLILDVFIPQVWHTIIEMISYLFVNSMITISAVSFLATTKNKPFSLLINQFEALMIIECSAVVSLLLLIINILCKGCVYFIKKKYNIYLPKRKETMKLTKKQFDIMVYISESNSSLTQRDIADGLSFSLGTVNKILTSLNALDLVSNYKITEEGFKVLEQYRVKRAIFIAAGFGSRLVPITLNTPKPLIRVRGKRIIETLLDAVIAVGIEEIYIVRGYLGYQFDDLLKKYPSIKLIDNSLYNESNNISSAVCVSEFYSNAYVMDADLFLQNPQLITKYQFESNYLAVPVERSDDWCLIVKNNRIEDISLGGENCHSWIGLSYWTEEDGKKLAKDLKEVFKSPGGKEKYWDQVPLEYYKKKYNISIRECSFADIVEIDTFNELKEFDKTYDV